jgi:predicted benzoate:H+ symporter BenE
VNAFDAAALLAAVLNDILALFAGIALLKPHRSSATNAGNQREQRALIVIHRFHSIQISWFSIQIS